MIRIRSNTLALCLILCSPVAAANDAVNRYLSATLDYPLLHSEPVDADASWLDQPELRYTGTDSEEHAIVFRFRPRFKSSRSAQNRIIELLNQQHSGQLIARQNDELKARYIGLIELIEIASEVRYLGVNLEISRQRLQFHRAQVETENFRIASLQGAEFGFHQAQQQLERNRIRMQRQLQAMDALSSRTLDEFLQNWAEQVIGWDNVLEINHRLSLAFEDGQIEDAVERIDFELAQQKLKLARSDSSNWLKFVEVKYVERPMGDQETSLGISIPLGSDDSGISQRAAELNQRSLALQQNRLQVERSLSLANRELYWLRDQAELLDADGTLLARQQKALQSANQPELTLDLTQAQLNNRREAQQLRLRGLRSYIELLHSTGLLAQAPLSNWLLVGQPEI